MKLLPPFLIFIQVFFVILLFRSDARADNQPCTELLHPLGKIVEEIMADGGIWGLFNKTSYDIQNHTVVTLRLDDKVTSLMNTLDYLCATENGVPYDELAQGIVPKIKEKGEKLFVEEQINSGEALEEAEELIKYAKFAESNRHRKLDFNQIKKTIKEAQPYFDRFEVLSGEIGKVGAKKSMADFKVLINDIEKFHETDPYLKQADYENSQVPHGGIIIGDSDEM